MNTRISLSMLAITIYGVCSDVSTVGATQPVNAEKILDKIAASRINFPGSVMIQNGFTAIGDSAFENREEGLSSLRIPKSVTTIGSNAFKNCSYLKDVQIDSTVFIGKEAFANCGMLNNIYALSAVSIGDYAFIYDQQLENVHLSKVKSIGVSAFAYCSNMSISFHELKDLKSIEAYAFWGTKLGEEIILPAGIESIGAGAFKENNVKRVILDENTNNNISIAPDAFDKGVVMVVHDKKLADTLEKKGFTVELKSGNATAEPKSVGATIAE